MSTDVLTRLVGVLKESDPVGLGLRSCWLDVGNAGGAVGFLFPPVSEEQMNEAMGRLINDVASGSLLVFVAERDDELLGWVSLRLNQSALTGHWRVSSVSRVGPSTAARA